MKKYKDSTGLTWEMIIAMSSEERAEYGIGEEPDWSDEDEAKWLKDKPRFIEELILEGKYLTDYSLDDLLEVYGVERAAYYYYINNKAQFVKDATRPGFGLDDCLRFYNCTQEEYNKYFEEK